DGTPSSAETRGASTDLAGAGRGGNFAPSPGPASAIVEAQWTARDRGRERFASEQPPYSILVRGIEADVLPTCQRYGMGVIPWSPLTAGWLSGQWRKATGPRPSLRADRLPDRFDLSLAAQQLKVDAGDQGGQAARGP